MMENKNTITNTTRENSKRSSKIRMGQIKSCGKNIQ
jgi:hypothetical protein